MWRRAAIAVLFLFAATRPARAQASSAAVPPEQDVELTADRIVYDWERRMLLLDGHVVVTRGPGILRAARGTLDRRTQILRLEGGVLAVQDRQVLVADAAVVNLESRSADLENATMFLKDRTAPPPSLLTDRAAVRGAGKNALILTGKRIRRLPSGVLVAETVQMTPCDCATEPDFELDSPEVEIEEDRARLSSPRLGILGASVPLVLPLSLPLTERQAGLLFPPLQFTALTGFGTEVPLFLPLGRSYDVTIAPGIFTGTGGASEEVRAQGLGAAFGNRTVWGPRLGFQFRYAPVERTAGQIDVEALKDIPQHDSIAQGPSYPGEAPTSAGRGFGGFRGTLRWSHRTDGDFLTAVAQGTIASDNMVISDTQPRELDRYLDALRTDLGLVHTQGAAAAGVDATILQDVRVPDTNHPDRRLFGAERRATFQRLPGVFGQLAPVRLGPLALGGELSAVRFGPFTALDPRERDTGFGPTDLISAGYVTPVTPVTDPLGLGRAPAVRFDVSPHLAWSAAGLPVLLTAELGARADAWLFEGSDERNRQRMYGIASVRAGLSLERAFGALLHTLEPSAELRAITPALRSGGPPVGDPFDAGGSVFASDPNAAQQGVAAGLALRGDPSQHVFGVPAARRPYDELDGAAPEDGEALLLVRLAQALWARPAAGRAPGRVVTLDLQQNVVLRAGDRAGRVGESGVAFGLGLGPVLVSGNAQYDWSLRDITVLGGGLNLRDARGDEAHGGVSLLRGAASERIRAGVDELFAAARVASDPGDVVGSASFGASSALPLSRHGLRAAYDATHLFGALPPGTADWSHRLGALYEAPCHCAGIQLYATFPFKDGKLLKAPSVSFLLDLKSLGSFGLSST